MDELFESVSITGTMVWYYAVCPREAWLLSHQLTPDEDDENIRMGRRIHEDSYARGNHEVVLAGSKMDRVVRKGGKLVVYEVKKSSRHEASARLQLLFYLFQMHEAGLESSGELHYPEEKRVVRLELGDAELKEISAVVAEVRTLIARDLPPPAKRIPVCRQCAYAEFCWA